MASYAGAYGAGAASDSLHRLLAERFEREKFDEHQRGNRSEEEYRRGQSEFQRDEARARASRDEADRSERREDRLEHRRQFDTEQKRRADTETVRAKERADDREAGLEGEDRKRRYQIEDREDHQNFQSYMDSRRAARERSTPDSEPLVAVKDPVTKQPRLVPRSQAVNMEPASTRDQAMTEGQSNASGFADRMKFNEEYIRRFDAGGATSRMSQAASFFMPNEMRSKEAQGYEVAKKNWIAANLRKESGAAIGKDEYANADLQYFPQPGEPPEVVEQKRQLRAVAESAMRRASGAGMGMGPDSGGGGVAPTGGGQAPRMTRKIRNPATGETRMQTSLDGGATWN